MTEFWPSDKYFARFCCLTPVSDITIFQLAGDVRYGIRGNEQANKVRDILLEGLRVGNVELEVIMQAIEYAGAMRLP